MTGTHRLRDDDGLDVDDIWQPENQRRQLFIEFSHPCPRYKGGEIIRIRSDTLSPAMLRSYRKAWLFPNSSEYHLLEDDDFDEEYEHVSAQFIIRATTLDGIVPRWTESNRRNLGDERREQQGQHLLAHGTSPHPCSPFEW